MSNVYSDSTRHHGGFGNAPLDFGNSASAPYSAAQICKPKYCELCGKSFLTMTMAPMRDCLECRTRQAKHRAEMAIVPPADGPEEEFAMKYENRRLAKAAHALSMRQSA